MNDNIIKDQPAKKNLTRDELANYLKNLKNKAPPKSNLITPPKSPTVLPNNNNNNNVPLNSSSSIVDTIPASPTEKIERKIGSLYGPRVYPSPNKTTSILTRSLSQKIEENIKIPSSPPELFSSSLPSSTREIDKSDDINELINDLSYPMEKKLSFKPINNQTTNIDKINNIDEEIINSNISTTKADDSTKGSYVLSAAFKSYNSKPASRTPSLINKTPKEIQSETDKNKKIYNSTVNILQKQHQLNEQLNSQPKNNDVGGITNDGDGDWSSRFDEAQKKFPQLEKYDENKGYNNNNNNNNNNNSIGNNISENNQEYKRNSIPTSPKIYPSNNQEYKRNSTPVSHQSNDQGFKRNSTPVSYPSNNQSHNGSGNNVNSNSNSRPSSSIYVTSPLGCASCGKPIAGKVVSAMGKKWHPDHFTCTKCDTPLEHVAFFEKDGVPYCHLDYHELFSPRCGYCSTPIEGQSITALGKSWHLGHFFCRECGGPFESGGFMVHDGFPYCEKDWMNKFAPKCKGCQNPIKGEFTSALDGKWHRDCFVCKSCSQPFHSSYYYIYQGQPYCDVHYNDVLSKNA